MSGWRWGSARVLAVLLVLVLGASAWLVLAVRAGDAPSAEPDGSAATPSGDRPTLGADGVYLPGTLAGDSPGDAEDAVRAAVDAVPPALSYDYAHLDSSLAAASSHLTPAFAQEFRATFDATVRPLARQKQAVSQARVRAAGLVDLSGAGDDARATVLVFVDQVLVSSKEMRRSEEPVKVGQTRVTLTLVRVGDAWKVDALQPL